MMDVIATVRLNPTGLAFMEIEQDIIALTVMTFAEMVFSSLQ